MTVITQRFDVKNNGDNDHSNESNEMGPNVSSFRMNPKYRIETGSKIAKFWAVSEVQIVVVSQKCRQFIEMAGFSKEVFFYAGLNFSLFCNGNFSCCVKVRKSQKLSFMPSILPENEQINWPNSVIKV